MFKAAGQTSAARAAAGRAQVGLCEGVSRGSGFRGSVMVVLAIADCALRDKR